MSTRSAKIADIARRGLRAARRPRTAPVSLLSAPPAVRPEWDGTWSGGGAGGKDVSGPVVLASCGAVNDGAWADGAAVARGADSGCVIACCVCCVACCCAIGCGAAGSGARIACCGAAGGGRRQGDRDRRSRRDGLGGDGWRHGGLRRARRCGPAGCAVARACPPAACRAGGGACCGAGCASGWTGEGACLRHLAAWLAGRVAAAGQACDCGAAWYRSPRPAAGGVLLHPRLAIRRPGRPGPGLLRVTVRGHPVDRVSVGRDRACWA